MANNVPTLARAEKRLQFSCTASAQKGGRHKAHTDLHLARIGFCLPEARHANNQRASSVGTACPGPCRLPSFTPQDKERAGDFKARPSITSAFKWGVEGDPKEVRATVGLLQLSAL